MDNKTQEELVRLFSKKYQDYNSRVLKKIAETIKQFKGLNYTEAHKLAQQLKYDKSYTDLINELSKMTNKDEKEIKSMLEETAKQNLEFADTFYKSKGLDTPIYKNSNVLKEIVNANVDLTEGDFSNIARNTGFTFLDKDNHIKFLNMKDTYHKVIDDSVYAVQTGQETFDSVMRQTINQLAESGVRRMVFVNEGKEQYTQRLDTVVRRNILDSIRQVSNETQLELGKEFGADGVEITVHSNPAPDHAEVQGRQFSLKEYKKLQEGKEAKDYKGGIHQITHSKKGGYRQISQYNCYHTVFSIILGVSDPLYSDKELDNIIEENNNTVNIDGKDYTKYEATQLQRQLETEIRKSKDKHIMYKETGDNLGMLKEQKRITQLTNKYREVTNKAGLPDFLSDRARVTGYKRISVKNLQEKPIKENNTQLAPLSKYQEIINKAEDTKLGKDTYKNMLEDYNKWYDTLDKQEIQKVLDNIEIHSQKTNNLNINKLSSKESNPLGEFINKKLGYDKLPELIEEKDFWIDENGKPTSIGDTKLLDEKHWYRGIGGNISQKDADKYMKEFKTGKFFAGEGYDANGTFASMSYSEATQYADDEKNIFYIIPKDNAKILPFEKINGLGYKISSQIDYNKYMNEEGELYINFTDKILNDNGYLASLLGYDIIDFKKYDSRKLILNRGAIKVVK